MPGELRLDLSKGVTEDGEEHVEENKEHEEDKTEKVDWTKDIVGLFQFCKVKIAQDSPNEGIIRDQWNEGIDSIDQCKESIASIDQ